MPTLQEQAKKEARDLKSRSLMGRVYVMGTNYLAGMLVLGGIGHFIDTKTHHQWRYAILGAGLGVLWATYEAFKLAYLLSKEDDKPKSDDPPKLPEEPKP